jgi:transposase InsO family protein
VSGPVRASRAVNSCRATLPASCRSHGRYQLHREGVVAARCTVERLMRADGLARRGPRRSDSYHEIRSGR